MPAATILDAIGYLFFLSRTLPIRLIDGLGLTTPNCFANAENYLFQTRVE